MSRLSERTTTEDGEDDDRFGPYGTNRRDLPLKVFGLQQKLYM